MDAGAPRMLVVDASGRTLDFVAPLIALAKLGVNGKGCKRRQLGLCVAFMALSACASTPAPQNPFRRAEAAPASDDRDAKFRHPGSSGPLVDSVVLLGASPDTLDPTLLSRVFRELSRALQPLSADAALDARNVAERMDVSPSSSLAHGSLVKEGLEGLLHALLSRPAPGGRQEEYRSALQTLSEAMKGVKDVAPLGEQRVAISAAFRAATDAVLLALNKEPPFRAQATSTDHEPLPVELEVERARLKVLELARARWTNGRKGASLALSALADVIAAADPSKTLEQQVAEVRFQAKRLGRANASSLGEAAWIKKALGVALDGLDLLAGRKANETSVWSRAARQAVFSIEERSTIGLQRASVQDAFRATIDAFAAELPQCARRP